MDDVKMEVLEEKVSNHDKELDNHRSRLESLEKETTKFEVRMENLIKQLEALTATMKWFIGLAVGALVSFFFYMVQNTIIK